MEFSVLKEVLMSILESGVYIVLILVGAFAIKGLKLLAKKFGIEFDNNEMDNIIKTVKYVINYIDQVFVDTLKKNSPDGTLTDKQKEIIKDKSFDLLNDLLTAAQMKYLQDKYYVEDVEEIYEILIEANIAEARSERSNGDIIINEEIISDYADDGGENGEPVSEIYTLTEDEIESITICPADCEKCTLRDDCDIARYPRKNVYVDNNISHDHTVGNVTNAYEPS